MEFPKLDNEVIGFYLLPFTFYLPKTSRFCTHRTHVKTTTFNILIIDVINDNIYSGLAYEVSQLEAVISPLLEKLGCTFM